MIKHRSNLFQAENAICLHDTNRGESFMKAVKTHVGRCDTCGEPAAYAQLLPGGRTFRFCEQHTPLQIKKQAEATAALEKEKK
jgi:hypothetical protein